MSPELSEALRNEIRTALDAGGKPFDVNVARRVYDLAIAARDMCIAATGSVKEAIDQIQDTNGPMETLQNPDTPESDAQVSETFGARIIRELIAMVPALRAGSSETDPAKLVLAIADAKERGMYDLAAKLEQKLIGTPIEAPKVTMTEVVDNSYEHGFLDGSMQDNFDRKTVNGHMARDLESASPAYQAGYAAGRARRTVPELPAPPEPELQIGDRITWGVGRSGVIQKIEDDGMLFILDDGWEASPRSNATPPFGFSAYRAELAKLRRVTNGVSP